MNLLELRCPFTTPEGVYHNNKIKLKMKEDYLQVYINNGNAGYADIRLTNEQMKELLIFVQCNIK